MTDMSGRGSGGGSGAAGPRRAAVAAVAAGAGVLAIILWAVLAAGQGADSGGDRATGAAAGGGEGDPGTGPGSGQGQDDGIGEMLDEIERTASENRDYVPVPREWMASGPFQIDRSSYLLGEKIFLKIGDLGWQERGEIVFLRPLNGTHYSVYQTIPFDGAKKGGFNYYVQPVLSKAKGLCSADDFVGEWTVAFRGTGHPNLKFKVTDEILPGEEDRYGQPVC